MRCARCGTVARKIHRPFLFRLLLPLAQLYYCWPCHRRFIRLPHSLQRRQRTSNVGGG
jgi:DNA-directed RNA polymerase subunit RPC12/RpoP